MASGIVNSPETSAPASSTPPARVCLRHRIEYAAAKAVLVVLGALPHPVVRAIGRVLAALAYWFWPRLRQVGMFNLRLAFPDWTDAQRRRVLRGHFRGFGRMLADLAHFPKLNRANIEKLIIYDGFEAFAQAEREGKGVLFLTAHFGNWELSSFAHGIYGHPLSFIVREMDNPLLDRLIHDYRRASGGRAIEKRDAAREVLRRLRRGEAVGILSDQNMLPGEGVFVNFFGIPACTTTAPARLARKTGAAVIFGITIWDEKLGKYRLRFERVPWIRRDDPEEEILVNTQNYARLLEEQARRYPEQWLWVHRRWKTRPPGEAPLYPF
jgi:KDO2-lipid IV(A) lauroyltransferase